MCPRSLSALIARIALGDRGALGQLFDQVDPLVEAGVHRCAPALEHDELVLRVFVRAWRLAPGYDPALEPVLDWLDRLVDEECHAATPVPA